MTNGGWGAIAVGIRMLTEPGDEVIYYDPPWFFYDLLIRGAEATPVTLRLEPPRFSPDPAALAAAITPKTRAVLLNTPHNPTGRILDDAELDAVAEVLREASDRHGRPIYLLSDEAYRLIVLDGRRAPSPAEHYDARSSCTRTGSSCSRPGSGSATSRSRHGSPPRSGRRSGEAVADRAVRQQLLVAERAPPARPAGHRRPRHRHRRDRAAPGPARPRRSRSSATSRPRRRGRSTSSPAARSTTTCLRRAARRGRRVRAAGRHDQHARLVPDLAHGERRDDRGVDRAVRGRAGAGPGLTATPAAALVAVAHRVGRHRHVRRGAPPSRRRARPTRRSRPACGRASGRARGAPIENGTCRIRSRGWPRSSL